MIVTGKRDYSIIVAADHSFQVRTAENRLIPIPGKNPMQAFFFTRIFDGVTEVTTGSDGRQGLRSAVTREMLLEAKYKNVLNHDKGYVEAITVEGPNELYKWTGDPGNPLERVHAGAPSPTAMSITNQILRSDVHVQSTGDEIQIGSAMQKMRNRRMEFDYRERLIQVLDNVNFGFEERNGKEVLFLRGKEVLVATEWNSIETREQNFDPFWFLLAYDKKSNGEQVWQIYAVDMQEAELLKVSKRTYSHIHVQKGYKHIISCQLHGGEAITYYDNGVEKVQRGGSIEFRYDGSGSEPKLIPQGWNGREYYDDPDRLRFPY